MSEYSTGELGKLFNISNRSIQFYDKKDLLKPAYIKDNNYRVYTEKEVEKLKIILILKNMDISLKDIKELLKNDKDMKSINLIISEKIKETEKIIQENKKKLDHMHNIKAMISEKSNSQIQKLIDIENAMTKNAERKKLYKKLFLIGGIGTFSQLLGISISFAVKSYLPFLISLTIAILCAILITNNYFQSVVYMCPNCHNQFKPKLLQIMFAAHTSKTRKLTCPYCDEKNHCLEVIHD
ncbi:MerR family transcriptional regulator [Staphylococcus nepalensis]|uniref:MerR family transcriptional regulator n=1 Tax=Staphylococcus nepalensis TaxID=214473 RepID=UPI001A98B09A|nr:MerR family transcriptional regulator [Staphylococcus nepalensis]MBO1222755.1 MerR family transcriptional regulator [Staphylococcus nepalensis]